MAAVLVAIGVLLYLRVGTSLNHAVDENLEARSAEVTRMAREGSISRSILPDDQDEQFAQLLDGQGRVIDATPQVAGRPTLDTQEVAMAAREQTWVTRRDVAGLDGPVRILARPLATPDGSEILLVGASLGERNATVRRLLEELFILGPLALLLASVLGYWLASAALKPVEAMRREAAGISAAEPGRRLPLPQPNDELRRLGETLNATFDQLEAALKLERSFVADAGHELRSPVSRLHTELELALRHPRRADELEDVVRSALAETRLLADLTENLLLLARSDHGALPVRRAPVAVDGMLETVAARYREQGARENRRVELDAPDDLVIMVDPVRMEQALRNMVENALVHGRGTVVL